MFAKLFDTPAGQCLLTLDTRDGDNGDCHPAIVYRLNGPSIIPEATAEYTFTQVYAPTDDGEATRDAAFEAFNQEMANFAAEKGTLP